MLKYLILFVSGLGLSLFLTPLVRGTAVRFGAVDLPGERKVHTRPIPRLGGVSIFIAFHLVLFAAAQFDFFYFPESFFRHEHYGWVFLATSMVLGVGVADDFRRLGPAPKFFFQILAALIVALTSYRIEVISLPFATFNLGIWAVPATVLWIVAVVNAVNLLDGLDGLASGTSLIVCITMFGISIFHQNIGIALVSVIFAGSILGFLKYNFHPASIFLGDSGAYFLGFELALLSLQSGLKGTTTIAILIPMIALGLPIMDTGLAMVRRLLKSLHIMEVDPKKNEIKFFFLDGWSMFRADRGHIHHRLLQLGFTQRKSVMILYAISLALGALAFSSVYFRNMNNGLFIATIILASYIGIRRLGYTEIQLLSNGSLLPLFDANFVSRRLLRVFVDMGVIAVCYYLAFMLRFEGNLDVKIKEYCLLTLPVVLAVKVLVFYGVGLYGGAWRYTNVADLVKMAKAVVLACAVTALILWLLPAFGLISRALFLIDFNLLLFFVIGSRSSFRILEHLHLSKNGHGRKVLIYGVGKNGVSALREFLSNPNLGLHPVGFIDDDLRQQGKKVNGYPVVGTLDSLEELLRKDSISEVILSIMDIPADRIGRLSRICQSCQIPLRRFQSRLEEITPAQN
jgi:UDP-GlcNAc:undecaprenyl-phosphate/decaprenyl-phosphate GlcNAc-1-phosphate transferase